MASSKPKDTPCSFRRADQDGRRRADRMDPRHIRAEVPIGLGVVVVDVDLHVRPVQQDGQVADSVFGLGIDDDKPPDGVEIDLAYFLNPNRAAAGPEVFADGWLLGAGKNTNGPWIQFFRGRHGGEAVEIRADMCCDEVHGPCVPKESSRCLASIRLTDTLSNIVSAQRAFNSERSPNGVPWVEPFSWNPETGGILRSFLAEGLLESRAFEC